jgi:hypothetical protein
MFSVDTMCLYGYPVSEISTRSLAGEIEFQIKHERPRFVQPEAFSLGPHWKNVYPCVPRRSGYAAQHRAVANRVARPVPKIGTNRTSKYKLLAALRCHVRRFCERHLRPFAPSKTFGFEEWLAKTHYEKWRKDEIRKVHERFPARVCWRMVRDHSRPKGFVKLESYPFFKFPRGIHARDDWIKSWIGPIIKEIEEQVYKLPQFIKHVPVADRPRYVQQNVETAGCVYVATDYSAFESSFHPELMRVCEFELYRYMCAATSAAQDIKLFQRMCCGSNILRYKDGTFVVNGRRMSGEMTTSLGNGWTNLMLATFIMRHRELRCVVEGDDGLFAIYPQEKQYFTAEAFALYGFVIKIEYHSEIETASFCGIVYARDVGFNLADPIQELIQFGWSFGQLRINKSRDLLVAKAMSLGYEYPGAPIMSSLSKYVLRVCGAKVDWDYVSHTMDLWHRDQLRAVRQVCAGAQFLPALFRVPVDERSRFVVERKFGVPIVLQRRTEEYLDSLTSIQSLDMPWLLHLAHPHNSRMGNFAWTFKSGDDMSKMRTVQAWAVPEKY